MSRPTRSNSKPLLPKEEDIPKELRDFNSRGLGETSNHEEDKTKTEEENVEDIREASEEEQEEVQENPQEVNSGEEDSEEEAEEDQAEEMPDDAEETQIAALIKALAGKKTVVSSSETKPPNYEGATDHRPAECWLARLDAIAQQHDWDDKKYVDAACNAMTKEAERWASKERFNNAMKTSNSMKTKANFRKAFLKMFKTITSPAEQIMAWTQLKQKPDENVRSFWIRVDTTTSEFVKHYLNNEKGWNIAEAEALVTAAEDETPPEDGENAQEGEGAEAAGGEAEPTAEEKAKEAFIIITFANSALRDMFFITGLKASISEKLKPRLNELMKMNYSLLDAALETEAGLNKHTGFAVVDSNVAAYGWNRGGGGGGRGRGGRGRGRGGRTPGGGYTESRPAGNPPGSKLKKIQARTRSIYCNRCCQWGKHYTNECRRTNSQIAALDVQDHRIEPNEVKDNFFDGLKEMPEKPKNDDQGN